MKPGPRGAPLRVVMVAGEASGDQLGAAVLEALSARFGPVSATGVGGPGMQRAGLQSLYPLERLAVMGLVEPLARLPELLRIRSALMRHTLAQPPDLFLGIDAPDFNLPLERALRARGVPTAHLVSPTVWAWRRSRLRGIARAVDMMLCLFPFELSLYREAGIPARYVGHPLANVLRPPADRCAARRALGLSADAPVLGLFPGSRAAEVRRLGPLFLEVAARLRARHPDLQLAVPAAGPAREAQLRALLAAHPALPVSLLRGCSHELLGCADAVLLASGTVTLESMLLDAPMVVAYRMAPLSWAIVSRLVHTPWAALPNILAARAVVPEFLQRSATPEALAGALEPLLEGPAAPAARAQRAAFAGQRAGLEQPFAESVLDALAAGPLRARPAPR